MGIPPSPQTRPDNDQQDNRRFWLGGILYANRNDPRIRVERPSGRSWTLNLARPLSWALVVGWALVICAIIVIVHFR